MWQDTFIYTSWNDLVDVVDQYGTQLRKMEWSALSSMLELVSRLDKTLVTSVRLIFTESRIP